MSLSCPSGQKYNHLVRTWPWTIRALVNPYCIFCKPPTLFDFIYSLFPWRDQVEYNDPTVNKSENKKSKKINYEAMGARGLTFLCQNYINAVQQQYIWKFFDLYPSPQRLGKAISATPNLVDHHGRPNGHHISRDKFGGSLSDPESSVHGITTAYGKCSSLRRWRSNTTPVSEIPSANRPHSSHLHYAFARWSLLWVTSVDMHHVYDDV